MTKIKRLLKKIIPYKIIKFRQDLIKVKTFRYDKIRMNWLKTLIILVTIVISEA